MGLIIDELLVGKRYYQKFTEILTPKSNIYPM
jgi:hypothetical protein